MIKFDRVKLDSKTEVLREEVRQFLDDNSEHLETRNSDFVTGHDPVFSKKTWGQGLDWDDLARRTRWGF